MTSNNFTKVPACQAPPQVHPPCTDVVLCIDSTPARLKASLAVDVIRGTIAQLYPHVGESPHDTTWAKSCADPAQNAVVSFVASLSDDNGCQPREAPEHRA